MTNNVHFSSKVLDPLLKGILVSILLFPFISFSKNNCTPIKVLEKDEVIIGNQSPEKIYVHFNKSTFCAEENIWFKVYLVNSENYIPGTNSELVYVDLFDSKGNIVNIKKIGISEGSGEGYIFLPFDLIEGEYTFRAYTNYMRNFNNSCFFKKRLYIYSQYSGHQFGLSKGIETQYQKMDLQFFPEGGHLVNDFNNRIAFKANNGKGEGADIDGEIFDEKGELITKFSTSKPGMGLFHLIPEKGKQYTATVNYNDNTASFALPRGLDKWILMRITEHKDHYKANFQSSITSMENYKFIARQRSGIVYDSKIIEKTNKVIAKIPKDILKTGVVQFTLYDSQNKPVAKRLSFFEGNSSSNPETIISLPKKEYGLNNEIGVEVFLDKFSQKDGFARMSISVTELPVNGDRYDIDIETYLLLISELKGKIENPEYYLHSEDPNRKNNFDILMLTQGWRQSEKSSLDNKKLNYLFEKGITLSGQVKSTLNRDRSIRSEVSLAYKNRYEQGYDVTPTDKNGRFIFRDLNFVDSTSVILKAFGLSGEKEIFIELDSIPPPKISSLGSIENERIGVANDTVLSTPINNGNTEIMVLEEDGLIELEEVKVKSKKERKRAEMDKNERRMLYKEASQTMDFTELRKNSPQQNVLTALLGRVPGLSVRGDAVYLRGVNSLQGSSKALLLVDGIPIDSEDASGIIALPISEIDFVDVLKGPRAAIYGSRAANGVLAIYTLNRTNRNSAKSGSRGILKYIDAGMSHSKRFYASKLENERIPENCLKTLFWNPNILMAKTNKMKFSFPSGEKPAEYKMIVEGITKNGDLIRSEAIIQVK